MNWKARYALAAWVAVLGLAAGAAAVSQRARVVWVLDGDTLTVRIDGVKERVRLLGIDAPELHDDREAWRAMAEEARAFAESELYGKTVTLESDPLAADRDDYGRLLRYAVLSDGTVFNDTMVRGGYARAYTRFALTRAAALREAEAAARREHLRYWGLPPGPARIVK